MGIDYSVELAIGYPVKRGELERVFGRVMPRVTHLEDRYDLKTGAKLEPIEVEDWPEQTVCFLPGADAQYALASEGMDEFLDELCRRLGARHTAQDNTWTGSTDFVMIMPEFRTDDTGFDEGHLSAGGGLAYAEVTALEGEMTRIGAQLRELGVEVERPVVRLVVQVS